MKKNIFFSFLLFLSFFKVNAVTCSGSCDFNCEILRVILNDLDMREKLNIETSLRQPTLFYIKDATNVNCSEIKFGKKLVKTTGDFDRYRADAVSHRIVFRCKKESSDMYIVTIYDAESAVKVDIKIEKNHDKYQIIKKEFSLYNIED